MAGSASDSSRRGGVGEGQGEEDKLYLKNGATTTTTRTTRTTSPFLNRQQRNEVRYEHPALSSGMRYEHMALSSGMPMR